MSNAFFINLFLTFHVNNIKTPTNNKLKTNYATVNSTSCKRKTNYFLLSIYNWCLVYMVLFYVIYLIFYCNEFHCIIANIDWNGVVAFLNRFIMFISLIRMRWLTTIVKFSLFIMDSFDLYLDYTILYFILSDIDKSLQVVTSYIDKCVLLIKISKTIITFLMISIVVYSYLCENVTLVDIIKSYLFIYSICEIINLLLGSYRIKSFPLYYILLSIYLMTMFYTYPSFLILIKIILFTPINKPDKGKGREPPGDGNNSGNNNPGGGSGGPGNNNPGGGSGGPGNVSDTDEKERKRKRKNEINRKYRQNMSTKQKLKEYKDKRDKRANRSIEENKRLDKRAWKKQVEKHGLDKLREKAKEKREIKKNGKQPQVDLPEIEEYSDSSYTVYSTDINDSDSDYTKAVKQSIKDLETKLRKTNKDGDPGSSKRK